VEIKKERRKIIKASLLLPNIKISRKIKNLMIITEQKGRFKENPFTFLTHFTEKMLETK
jgi:hypothetical protein